MTPRNFDRAAIRRLRRGIVPTSHILRLSVGLEPNLLTIAGELKRLTGGKSRACFIQGEWGAGKTHLLAALMTRRRTCSMRSSTGVPNASQ